MNPKLFAHSFAVLIAFVIGSLLSAMSAWAAVSLNGQVLGRRWAGRQFNGNALDGYCGRARATRSSAYRGRWPLYNRRDR